MRCRKECSLLVRLPVGLCDDVSRSCLRKSEYHTMMRENRGSGAAYSGLAPVIKERWYHEHDRKKESLVVSESRN